MNAASRSLTEARRQGEYVGLGFARKRRACCWRLVAYLSRRHGDTESAKGKGSIVFFHAEAQRRGECNGQEAYKRSSRSSFYLRPKTNAPQAHISCVPFSRRGAENATGFGLSALIISICGICVPFSRSDPLRATVEILIPCKSPVHHGAFRRTEIRCSRLLLRHWLAFWLLALGSRSLRALVQFQRGFALCIQSRVAVLWHGLGFGRRK